MLTGLLSSLNLFPIIFGFDILPLLNFSLIYLNLYLSDICGKYVYTVFVSYECVFI